MFDNYVMVQNSGELLMRTTCMYFHEVKSGKKRPINVAMNDYIPTCTRVEIRVAGWNPDSVVLLKQILKDNRNNFKNRFGGNSARVYRHLVDKFVTVWLRRHFAKITVKVQRVILRKCINMISLKCHLNEMLEMTFQ